MESFQDVLIEWPRLTEFQQRVLETTREIRYGETLTYGQLAARAGSPRAARAVGTVMANNRFPIVVPCHRVVGSGNGLGGFSAPQGTTLKRLLLELEAANCEVRVRRQNGTAAVKRKPKMARSGRAF